MADTILVRAINGNVKSKPIKVFQTKTDVKLPSQFVLRLDASVNREGEEQIKLNNINLNLIASHNPEWLTEAVTGFRRDKDEVTYIIAELVKDDMPVTTQLAKVEAY